MRIIALIVTSSILFICLCFDARCDAAESAARWPRFRGPAGSGVAPDEMNLPEKFSPTENVVWKTALPSGHSSPCMWDGQIYLTSFDDDSKKLETICLDRRSGQILWRQSAPVEKLEKIHTVNNPAASTPAVDDNHVVAYFGSYGLICYDSAGHEQWKKPLPMPETRFGSATSPVIADNLVILNLQGNRPRVLAVNIETGELAWEKERVPYRVSYSVPLVWTHDSMTEIIVQGSGGIISYDPRDGSPRWWVGGLAAQDAIPSPVVGDNVLFVAASVPGGDPDNRIQVPPYAELLSKYDADKDGYLSKKECEDLVLFSRGSPDHNGDITLGQVFSFVDANKDGKIGSFEWGLAGMMANQFKDTLVAVRPGGKDDATKTHVVWRQERGLPECPSPLYYQGRLYMIKGGGVFTCLDASSGKIVYRKRLDAAGQYYASPVAGDGKIFLASEPGIMTVVAAGDDFEVLSTADLGEKIMATPALTDEKLYVRTAGHLYAFGK